MDSETSVNQKFDLESGGIPEPPGSTETSDTEESIVRTAVSTEINSQSLLLNLEKESCALEESISDVTSQLVSIQC